MKTALIHDWLTGMRGGEKVLESLCHMFPNADIFTLVHIPGSVSQTIESHRITTSPLQRFPRVRNIYRHLLPLMPWAIERFDLSGYDLILSSSHCVAKGVRVPKGVPHICYCHTPMRYIWDQYDEYFGPQKTSFPLRMAMAMMRPPLKRWDVATSNRVTHYIANSENVLDRIRRFYGRSGDVVYPPVETGLYIPAPSSQSDYYLIVSAFAPYKRVDLAIDVFNKLKKPLMIIGAGQDEQKLKSLAGPHIVFKGWTPTSELVKIYQSCKALIFPGEEDFGIVPVEAMSCGKPVIAFRKGGALETVKEGVTGLLFDEQTVSSLSDAVIRSEATTFDPGTIRQWATRFSKENFVEHMRESLKGQKLSL
ncbi:MAG TPA: glycosyltransferase [Elusimicrobiota bacterium]|nr:glycosyltransferase [Elusimicrobiota bacterium]